MKSSSDKLKVDETNFSLWKNRYNDTSGSLKEALLVLSAANSLDYQKGVAYSRLNIAACCFLQSENDIAFQNLSQALGWFSDNIIEPGFIWALNLKGSLFESLGDYENALQFCLKAHRLSTEINDREAEAETCSQLGLIYTRLSNFEMALEYYQQGLKIREEMNDENALASSLNRIGMIKRLTKNYEESLEYYFKSLELRRRNKQFTSIPWTFLGIASTYEEMQKTTEALDYYNEGIKGSDKRCALQCKLGSGRLYSVMGRVKNAEERLEDSLKLALELGAVSLVAEAYAGLANHYESIFRYDLALKNHKLYHHTKESFQSDESRNRLRNIEISHAVEKSENEKEIYRLKHVELKEAYDLVREKNKYITDSINYASAIQSALLTDPDELRNIGNDCFILYLPKETISGDFYWLSNTCNKLIVTAGDCTGHGVPGALMSMLAISFLEEIVNYRKITDSGKILDELKKKVQNALHQKGLRQEVKDGLDISLCVIDRTSETVQYSGAYNNLYLIRDNKLIEFKADRMPIGIFEETDAKFSSTNIKIFPADIIYMFSDGYADQFGGPNRKKYKYPAMKDLLLKIHELPLQEQKQCLEKEFHDWKGANSQTDDILIMGLKI